MNRPIWVVNRPNLVGINQIQAQIDLKSGKSTSFAKESTNNPYKSTK
jgi:hypothetical protein